MAKLPLEGVRVVDMTIVWAGPYTTALLADLGAEVIRVESTKFYPPITRGFMAHPSEQVIKNQLVWLGGLPDREIGDRPWNRAPLFNSHARNKLSMTVDLLQPSGKEVLSRLVSISDVFIENTAMGTMEKLGITYDRLKESRPDIIMVRMPAFGSTGKYANYRAMGQMVEDVAGHTSLRGYTDMDATGVTSAFTADAGAGVGAAFAVLAALHYRRRTGKGQFVELAMVENFLPYLGEAIMDYNLNGRVQSTLGNRHPYAVQGCYPCEGEDRWVNITIYNDSQWEAFCGVIGNPDWSRDEKYADPVRRYEHHDELDRHVGEWTRQHGPYEVMDRLQNAGVPAGAIMASHDAYNDPHLRERGAFEQAYQEDCGTHLYPGAPFKLSETPPKIRRGPVRLGEDNEYVYKTLLQVSDEEYAQLEQEGHIGMDYGPDVP
jgi:crotonobetainyl-CoA:carnitine CoA-transferase CaiB-like acyl-CoA transferase